MKHSLLFTSLLFFHTVCAAQDGRSNVIRSNSSMFDAGAEISGAIKHDPGAVVGNLTVELVDPVKHSSPISTAVSSNGDFYFSGVRFGTYTLRVLSMTGVTVAERLVDVREAANTVEIELLKAEGAKPGTGTVSIAELMHRVPPNALKDFNNALRAIKKKDEDGAIDFLEKAVEIDPEFVEAQSDLGRLYIQKREPEKVLSAFGQVLKIDPHSEVANAGSSVALIWLNRLPEAEASARKALEINPASLASHYFLGVSLASQAKDDQEAVEHLDKCASSFPDARIKAAEILARHRDFSAATVRLEDYLKSGTTERRDQVNAWLEQLKKAQNGESARQ